MSTAIELFIYVIYPLISLLAWWNIHKHQQYVKDRLLGMDKRVNGRLDELIAAKEEIAFRRGIDKGLEISRKVPS
jgi:hypothetical protein